MKVTGHDEVGDRYVVTNAYGRDIGLENLPDSEVVAVTDVKDDVYRCSDNLTERQMGNTLDTIVRYLDRHGFDTPDNPVDKRAVPHDELQEVAERLEPVAEESSRKARRKMEMLNHERAPEDS